jgi:hypothetical protein
VQPGRVQHCLLFHGQRARRAACGGTQHESCRSSPPCAVRARDTTAAAPLDTANAAPSRAVTPRLPPARLQSFLEMEEAIADFSVEAAGPRTIKVAVPSASRLATAGTILRCDEELLISGYLWKRFSLCIEGDYIELGLEAPEILDEHNCSSGGARSIKAKFTLQVERQGGAAAPRTTSATGTFPGRTASAQLRFGILRPEQLAEFLADDALSFSVTIDIIQPALTPPPHLAPPGGPPPDLTLTFSDGSPPLQVHQQMLQLASPVFGGLLSDLPGTSQLQLRERSHDMHLLLSFLYPALRPKPSLTLRGAAAVAALADKYDCAAAVVPCVGAIFSKTYDLCDEPDSSAYVISWLQVGGRAVGEDQQPAGWISCTAWACGAGRCPRWDAQGCRAVLIILGRAPMMPPPAARRQAGR